MAPKFNPIIRRARFVAGDIPAEVMLKVGVDLRNAVRERIRLGFDANDNPAPPLNPRYARFKQFGKDAQGRSYNGKPIRNWELSGVTLRSMQVLSTGPNRAVIGFDDSSSGEGPLIPRRNKLRAPPSVIAAINNAKSR